MTQFADNTNVGNPDELIGIYTGPPGQGRDFAPGFNTANYLTIDGDFPTRNVFLDDNIQSPITKEFTLSVGGGFGPSSYAKVTYINRRASEFVEDFLDLTTGSTEIIENGQSFGTFTNQLFKNTDFLTRDYDAVQVQTRLQVTDDFLIDGTYTVQLKNDGNFEGESTNRPASSSPAFDFPEITPEARYFPTGRLDEFQRHKLRIWGIYNLGMERFGDLGIGGIWRVNSGLTYSNQSNGTRPTATQAAILDDLRYDSAPSRRTLYDSDGRGSGSFAGYGLFDLSVNYNVPVWKSLSPWFKAEIFNLFGNDKLISWDTTVVPDTDGPVDELGIPTNFTRGGRFGEATSPGNYPQYLPNLDGLRAFRLAFGLRF